MRAVERKCTRSGISAGMTLRGAGIASSQHWHWKKKQPAAGSAAEMVKRQRSYLDYTWYTDCCVPVGSSSLRFRNSGGVGFNRLLLCTIPGIRVEI